MIQSFHLELSTINDSVTTDFCHWVRDLQSTGFIGTGIVILDNELNRSDVFSEC